MILSLIRIRFEQNNITVVRFVSIIAKIWIYTVMGLNGTTLVEAKIRSFKCPISAYFSFNKCPISTRDNANAKHSTNWDETDYSADWRPYSLDLGEHVGFLVQKRFLAHPQSDIY